MRCVKGMQRADRFCVAVKIRGCTEFNGYMCLDFALLDEYTLTVVVLNVKRWCTWTPANRKKTAAAPTKM
jgi:hypothetical protein